MFQLRQELPYGDGFQSNKCELKFFECKKTGHISISVCVHHLNENQVFGILILCRKKQLAQNKNQPIYKCLEQYYTQVRIKQKSIKFEADSGSAYMILLRSKFAELKLNAPLKPATVRSRLKSGEFIHHEKKSQSTSSTTSIKFKTKSKLFQKNIIGQARIARLIINLTDILINRNKYHQQR